MNPLPVHHVIDVPGGALMTIMSAQHTDHVAIIYVHRQEVNADKAGCRNWIVSGERQALIEAIEDQLSYFDDIHGQKSLFINVDKEDDDGNTLCSVVWSGGDSDVDSNVVLDIVAITVEERKLLIAHLCQEEYSEAH